MFKTFSGKFFAVNLLIACVTFLILFSVFSQVVSDHFVAGKYRSMLDTARSLSEKYLEIDADSDDSSEEFSQELTAISYHISSRIMIFNDEAMTLYDSDHSSLSLKGQVLSLDELRKALKGETVTTIKDSEDHYFSETAPIIMVISPIKDGETVKAAICIYGPFPSVKNEINYIYRLLGICFFILLLVSLTSSYYFSRNISSTFRAFNKVSKSIAEGDFTARVNGTHIDPEIDKLAENMNYMAQELGKLEDLRKDFIANISHDFRSPLTSIRGYVQAVMDGTIPPEKYEKYLSVVLDETDRLTKLTNDILLLTKMENEVQKPEKEDFDLHECIRKVLLQFEQKILQKGINMTLLIEEEDIIVHADYNQIQRAITNIVDNAIKFCNENDEITVETTLIGKKVRINIKDSGPGISKEDIKYIWTRFHKSDRSRGRDKKGVGLGLSIVQEIIKAHGEKIDVYSQEGKGTTFTFTLSLSEHPEIFLNNLYSDHKKGATLSQQNPTSSSEASIDSSHSKDPS